jgi:hypothetical protein
VPGRATDQLLDALRGHGSAVKEAGTDRAGRDRWMAQCPVPEHDDRTPSLSVTDTETRVIFHCFAGCGGTAVLEALDLGSRDLYHKRNTVYDYGGELKSTRKYTADGTRTFSVKGDAKDQLRPLYRVGRVKEAVAAGEPVWVVEGEEDVHTVELFGGVGTTSLGGARVGPGPTPARCTGPPSTSCPTETRPAPSTPPRSGRRWPGWAALSVCSSRWPARTSATTTAPASTWRT